MQALEVVSFSSHVSYLPRVQSFEAASVHSVVLLALEEGVLETAFASSHRSTLGNGPPSNTVVATL